MKNRRTEPLQYQPFPYNIRPDGALEYERTRQSHVARRAYAFLQVVIPRAPPVASLLQLNKQVKDARRGHCVPCEETFGPDGNVNLTLDKSKDP